jgi:hypothetical protein
VDLFFCLQVVPQIGKVYFVKLCFLIGQFLNGITKIYFDLHIYLWIHVAVMNCDTKVVVLDSCTVNCINRIFQSYSNLLQQREIFHYRLKHNGFYDL